MSNKATVTIDGCEQCPFFDNFYYSYNEKCTKLGRKIECGKFDSGLLSYKSLHNYPIPDDCPLLENRKK